MSDRPKKILNGEISSGEAANIVEELEAALAAALNGRTVSCVCGGDTAMALKSEQAKTAALASEAGALVAEIAKVRAELDQARNMMGEKWPTSFGHVAWGCGHTGPGVCIIERDQALAKVEILRGAQVHSDKKCAKYPCIECQGEAVTDLKAQVAALTKDRDEYAQDVGVLVGRQAGYFKQIDDLSEQVKVLREAVIHVMKYLKSCGHDGCDHASNAPSPECAVAQVLDEALAATKEKT